MEEITVGRDLAPAQVAKLVREKQNLQDFGLKYMFDIQKDLVLMPDIIDSLFATICKIATRIPIEKQEVPEAPAEGEEAGFDDKVAEINEANANAEIENAKYAKLQQKVVIKVRTDDEFDEEKEKALLKLNNWRETVVNEQGQVVQKTELEPNESGEAADFDQFDPDKIPPKILVVHPKISETGDVISVYHPEATY